MDNKYEDDVDSFVYEEISIINEDEWNIDDIFQNVSSQFSIIEENEWNVFIDSCFCHDDKKYKRQRLK